MKFYLSILLILLLQVSLFSQKKRGDTPEYLTEAQFKDYIPISPIEYEQGFEIVDSTGESMFITMRQLAFNKTAIINFLKNEAVSVQISSFNSEGKISYGPASISGEKGSYRVVMDYVKFNTLKVKNEKGGCDGFTKVGVGLRLRADIVTYKANLNLGGLFGIGVEAEAGNLAGSLTIDVIGMESKEITSLIPLPSEISSASIQSAIQAMAAIKSQIYNDEVSLYPQILAVKKTSGTCGINDILKDLTPNSSQTQKMYQNAEQGNGQQIQQKK